MSNIVEKEINGVVYRAKFNGVAYAIEFMECLKFCSTLEIGQKLFKEVLISPKCTVDDFDCLSDYNEVHSFLLNVMQGNIAEKKLSQSQLKRRAKENWAYWRLIYESEGAISYQTVFGKPYMTPQDVGEANAALDLVAEARKKAAKKRH